MNTMRWSRAGLLAVLMAWFGAGCEGQDTSKREVRVHNDSVAAVRVLVDSAEVMVVPPNDGDAYEVESGLHKVQLTAEDGRKMWEQYIDLAEGQYAKFTVKEDGSVVGSGGLTYDPEYASGPYYSQPRDEDAQLRISNHREDPVHIWVDGRERKVVAGGDLQSVDPGGGRHLVEFRTGSGTVLFSQEVSFRDNQYILYTIERDGSVIASGGSR